SVVALREDAHIGIDSLTRRLPRKAQVVAYIASHLLMLGCTWLVFQGSLRQTQLNWSNHMPISGASVGLLYGAALVASVLWALIILFNIYRALRGDIGNGGSNRPQGVEQSQ